MSLISPSPRESSCQKQESNMGRAFRTPSPAPLPHLSSVETTPRTPGNEPQKIVDIDEDVSQGRQCGRLPCNAFAFPITSPRPRTPTFKRIKTDWHGLPSPQTPSFTNRIQERQIVDSAQNGHGRHNDQQAHLSLFSEHEGQWSIERDTEAQSQANKEDTGQYSNAPDFLLSPDSTVSPQTCKIGPLLRKRRNPTDSTDTAKRDAAMALELSTSLAVRRSTRLRSKLKLSYDQKRTVEPTKPTKPAKKALQTLRDIEKPLLSFIKPNVSPFEVANSSSDELPAVLSTEWQLKYPPGGSTHPSYPWPSADSRLMFQSHHIPVLNGLPNISHLSALILPTGWRHISWSGLNPVVFDPHHQAFKLTQVGPLPLTSEELHQGGLHNYVPGGKSHPEAGLLPLLSALSDGSDTDIFNFDGVDWALPWAQIEGLPLDSSYLANTTEKVLITRDQSANSNLQKPTLYVEARDCPDDVFDLKDGWRWLSNKEMSPNVTFSPTPGRRWRGLGVQRTSRKVKQPIAALMAIAIAEKEGENPERYLGNQRLREFCVFKSIATPVYINITLLQDVEFTLVELLWFFPNHYQWRKAGDRLIRSGFSASNIANFINMSRHLSGTSICNNSTVHGHLLRSQEEEGAATEKTRTNHHMMSCTAEDWTYSASETTDYPLLALAHGLLELPCGPDAGPLTAIIKWCRDNNRYRAMLSDVPALLKEANIEPLIEPGESSEPDQEVLSRHTEAIRKDRQRVLQEKRESESGKNGESMKRKVV